MSTIVISNIKATGETASRAVSGVAAAWVQFYGYTGALAINDSQNVSSLTDNGTGEYGVNFSSSFSSANYSRTASCDSNAGTYGHVLAIDNLTSPTSSSVTVVVRTSNGGTFFTSDRSNCNVATHGDLA